MSDGTEVKTKKGNVVSDAIWRMLQRSCTPKESGKYLGAVHLRTCSSECWNTIACTEGLEFPVWTRESIELSTAETCDLNDDIVFAEFIADRVARADSWTLEMDFKSDAYSDFIALFESGEVFVLTIELNDPDQTQLAFAAIMMSTPTVTVPARSDADLTRLSIEVQPTGKYFYTSGVKLYFCND